LRTFSSLPLYARLNASTLKKRRGKRQMLLISHPCLGRDNASCLGCWSCFCGGSSAALVQFLRRGAPFCKRKSEKWLGLATEHRPWLSTEGAFDGGHGAHHGHFLSVRLPRALPVVRTNAAATALSATQHA
jgi:hypothetical protein